MTPNTSQNKEPTRHTGIEMLLVDDQPVVLQTLAEAFEKRAFVVHTAHSRRAALHLLSRRSFELVVTDMRMETTTAGFDVVRAAKSKTDRPTAVAILTAFPLPASEWRKSGADMMILKGSRIDSRLDELTNLVHRRLAARNSSAPSPE